MTLLSLESGFSRVINGLTTIHGVNGGVSYGPCSAPISVSLHMYFLIASAWCVADEWLYNDTGSNRGGP